MMVIKYDKPFEVTRSQYAALMSRLHWAVAGQYDKVEKKFYIKVWKMNTVLNIHAILAST